MKTTFVIFLIAMLAATAFAANLPKLIGNKYLNPDYCPSEFQVPCFCPAIFQPVCSSDYCCYSNSCVLSCAFNFALLR